MWGEWAISFTISKGDQISLKAWLQAVIHLKVNVLFLSINYLIRTLFCPRLYSEVMVALFKRLERESNVYIYHVTNVPIKSIGFLFILFHLKHLLFFL